MELNKDLIEKYESLGLDMYIGDSTNTLKLNDLQHNTIKYLIKVYTNRLQLHPNYEDITLFCNTMIYILNDLPNKKRILKIKHIKDKINGIK